MRRLLGLVTLVAVLLGVGMVSASAGTTTTVDLHPPHVGSSSDCAASWHFVLNQLESGASAGTLTATYQNAGVVSVGASKVLLHTEHYDVVLGASDVLLGASVAVSGEHPDAKLVLSHVECVEQPPITTTTTTTPKETTTTSTTTTSTTSTTTTSTTSTTTTATTSTTTTATITVPSTTPPTSRPEELPFTGFDAGEAAGVGFGFAALGALALAMASARRET